MKLSISIAVYWVFGALLDIFFGLGLKDFGLPEDFWQQMEVELISDVVKVITWGIGGVIWIRIVNRYTKNKGESKDSPKK